jgi:4-hydroxy-4-methyl-2-oxoglutarate aldolase
VTDGLVRDLVGILGVGLPVYCAGLTPNSPVRNGPGTVGLPVVLGGVTIASGDVLVGDDDGVVVIPRAELDTVSAKLADVRAAEAALEAKVKAGLELPDFVTVLLASDKISRID